MGEGHHPVLVTISQISLLNFKKAEDEEKPVRKETASERTLVTLSESVRRFENHLSPLAVHAVVK
jgi:hypothetical protein